MPDPPGNDDPYATAKKVREYVSPALSLFARYALLPFHQNEAAAERDNQIRNMPVTDAQPNKILVGMGIEPAPGESNAQFYDKVWGAQHWYPNKALEDVYLNGKPRVTADTSSAPTPPAVPKTDD